MNVVAPCVYCDYVRIEISQDSGGIGAQRFANKLGQDRFTVLSAEDEMNENFGKRLRHCSIPAPLQGAREIFRLHPGRCPGLSPTSAFSAGPSNQSSDHTRRSTSLGAEYQAG